MICKNKMKKKLMAIALCTIIGVMAIAGSSLAWLQDSTQTVVNTFTEGKVDIELKETGTTTNEGTDYKDYKMVPGDTYSKDPAVTVKAISEKCYVFVKVEEVNNVDGFLTYAIDDDWTELTEGSGIYYRVVDDTGVDQTFYVLAGNATYPNGCVSVNTDVDMDAMNGLTTSGKYPQLKFTAYAVQYANVDSAAEAWEIFFPTTPTT